MESNNDRATRMSLGGVTQDAFSGNSNAKKYVKTVEGMIDEGQGLMREYKREIDNLKKDINLLEKKITNINQNENIKGVVPIIHSDLNDLLKAIEAQRTENENLQKQLTSLKKDKADMFYRVEEYEDRCGFLEKKLGFR